MLAPGADIEFNTRLMSKLWSYYQSHCEAKWNALLLLVAHNATHGQAPACTDATLHVG